MKDAVGRIVRTLIEQYDWALLQEEDLVELVLGSIQSEVSPAEVRKRTVHHYTAVLYEACRQDNDPDRRERGYHELHRYLYRAAYNKWPESPEDVTQEALLLVYEKIDRCRNPGAFLAFALWELRAAIKKEIRRKQRECRLEKILVEIFEETRGMKELPSLEKKELLEVLSEAIKRLPSDRMRHVICLKYFEGLSHKEISKRLGITANYVGVLLLRAKRELKLELENYFELGDGEAQL